MQGFSGDAAGGSSLPSGNAKRLSPSGARARGLPAPRHPYPGAEGLSDTQIHSASPGLLSAAVSPRAGEQPNFASFIKRPRLPGGDIFAQGLTYARAAGTCPQAAAGSGLSPPPPSSKEASAQRRLPHPRGRQAHGTAWRREGTKGRCFPLLPLMQELASTGGCSPAGWDCSQSPRRLLILGEAVQLSGGRLQLQEGLQGTVSTVQTQQLGL